jgi:hypothetical protein
MEVEYYIASGQQRLGPFTIEQLATQGLQPATLVWCEGMPQWTPASTVQELLHLLAVPVNPYPQQAPLTYATPTGQNPNRIAAGICGLFFGQFGVHKFIAGLTTGAVTMLCITLGSLVGGLGLMCIFPPAFLLVFAPAVMHVIGLIEGIIYLTCTDEQFYEKYVVRKQQWF